MELSIVILNWNVAGMLASCLRSLPAACGELWERTEVIVVDNGSTDDSVALVREEFPGVRVIALPENRGFSGGNNEGIRASRGEYIFLLNADTVCHAGSISRLYGYMVEEPSAGIVGPRLLNADGSVQPSRRRFPSIATALVESTPLQPLFRDSGLLRRYYMADQPDDVTQDVGWLSGAALLCRRETLSQCGLLDTGYFMFSEEMDLCRRVREAGWRVVYVADAQITHLGGGSTDQAITSRHINFNTSKARYFRKHEGALAGGVARSYLLGSYVAQSVSEGAKWLVGHKRPLRAERLRMNMQVLRSGLRPQRYRLHGRAKARVLLITGEFPPDRGGVGDYTCRLALALREEGASPDVLAQAASTSRLPRDERKYSVGLEQELRPLRTRRITLRSVLRALRGTHASLAHIEYQTGAYGMRPTANLLPVLLRALWGKPAVVTFHDLRVPYLFPKAGVLREWANRLLALGAAALVATNPEDAARLRSWGVRRVEVIPIGSNIANDPPSGYSRDLWRAKRGITPETTLLAYFGFLNSTKGIDDLLHALSLLRSGKEGGVVCDSYRLMMVGGGVGSSDPTNLATAERVDALARELGVDDLIIWTGFLEPQEVSAALLASDMAVLPFADGASFRRGSLMAVLEHGLPVVTTSGDDGRGRWAMDDGQSGWPVLRDKENCLLVLPGDYKALARAIERVAGDVDLRATLGAGSHRLAAYFGWERIARLHVELYDELAKEGTRRAGQA